MTKAWSAEGQGLMPSSNLALLPHSVTVPTVSHDQLRCGTYGPQESIQFEQSLTTSRQSQATQRVVVGGLLSAQRQISQP